MEKSSGPSASVVAAAVVAILGALLLVLSFSLSLFAFLLVPLPNTSELPPWFRIAVLVTMAIAIATSIYGIVVGVGLIRLRNWARISVLIWGGLCAFFGAIGIPFAFLVPNFVPSNAPQLPESSENLLRGMLFLTYGVPLIIGVWWLILFNRKSVKAQFTGTGETTGAALPQKPRCPLPVTVLAWFYLLSILNFALLPFIPVEVPVFIFGMALPHTAGLILLLLTAVGLFSGGVAILKLRPWGYSLTMGLQMFWLASTAVSLLNENYKAAMIRYMKQFQARMELPASQFSLDIFGRQFMWMMTLALVISGVILGILIYYRPRFLEAANEAKSLSESHVPS